MEIDGLKNYPKRICREKTYAVFESDSSSNGSMEKDPFHSSDDDKDLDYQCETKKGRTTHQNKKTVSKPKPAYVTNKRLTPSQRIARLKRKTAVFDSITQSKGIRKESVVSTNKSQVNVAPENLDQMFDKIQNGDNDMSNEIASIGKNTDYIIYSNEINGTGNAVAEHFFLNDSSLTSARHENFNLVEMMLEMRTQMTDLANNVTILRKQVSRVEMKGLQMNSRSQSSSNFIDSDLLYDFEGALSREGLPFQTCVEVNDFEKKLRNEDYRKKMVRVEIFISFRCCFRDRIYYFLLPFAIDFASICN